MVYHLKPNSSFRKWITKQARFVRKDKMLVNCIFSSSCKGYLKYFDITRIYQVMHKTLIIDKFMVLKLVSTDLYSNSEVKNAQRTRYNLYLLLFSYIRFYFQNLANTGNILTLSIKLWSCSFSLILNKYKAYKYAEKWRKLGTM